LAVPKQTILVDVDCIQAKLGVRSRVATVVLAIRRGLL
jgi:DNA-binding CsgD family transcriptional regulator